MSVEQALVLVVDDNEMNRDMLSRRLERQGYQAIMAEDGVQALEMLPLHPIDLVLLDIMMPRMNGYEVLEKAKQDPALRHIPIIMISAVDDLDSVVKCVEMGADDYLFKPFNPILLKARISASLEKKRLRDQEQVFRNAGGGSGGNGLNTLPASVAERVNQGQGTVADSFAEATVLYASITGLDRVSNGFSAGEMVDLLNNLLGEFDQIAAHHGIYRLKTIGNTYIAAGGVPSPMPNHVQAVADAALDMQAAVTRWKTQTGGPLGSQIGIHTGSAIGGVIRAHNSVSYDLWGEAVTLAGTAQIASPADAITLTQASARALGNAYRLENAGQIQYQGTSIPVSRLSGHA
ncbi:MAG: adenylate/guanylate cyclase domain-containing protein [Chloroflexota bacterium]